MNNTQQQQPTEEEIWALKDKNPRGEEWPERLITWNPHSYYKHTIGDAYFSLSTFEWIFHFLCDKSISKHKKERVLRIMFRDKGRQVRLIASNPLTFMVVSEPESAKTGKPAHAYTVTMTWNGSVTCPCEWEETTAHSETCTHCICVRTYFHFLFRIWTNRGVMTEPDDRKQQTSEIQRESQICTH